MNAQPTIATTYTVTATTPEEERIEVITDATYQAARAEYTRLVRELPGGREQSIRYAEQAREGTSLTCNLRDGWKVELRATPEITSASTTRRDLEASRAAATAQQQRFEMLAEELHDDFETEHDTEAGPVLRDRARKAADVARAYDDLADALSALIEACES